MCLYPEREFYLFSGTSNLANLSSSYIESILDSISDTNLALTICRAVNGELWVVIDENNDGKLDSIYILNLKDVIIENITTEIPEWKVYKFNFNINDILPRVAGVQRGQVLAATDLSDNFIRLLESGSADKDITDTSVDINRSV